MTNELSIQWLVYIIKSLYDSLVHFLNLKGDGVIMKRGASLFVKVAFTGFAQAN